MSDLYGSPMGGGLMGMFANPQTAGLLGLAGGLLQASGPTRLPVSNGQALGMGLAGMGQGFNNALQMQMEMAKMRAQLDPFGAGFGGISQTQSQTPNPTLAQGAPIYGAANSGPMSGLSAGLGGMAPQMPPQQFAPSNGLSLFGGHTPQEVMTAGARLAAFGNPAGAEMMKIAAQADPLLTPTDATKMALQSGATPEQVQAANAAALRKSTYIAPTALRTPIYYDPQTGTTKVVDPAQLAAGYGAQYGAEARAQAGFKPMQVWDPRANGGKGGFVFQTAANMADAANGDAGAPQVPVGIRNNNFGNIKGADGQFATYDTPQAGINAADQLLATYGAKHGINTIAGIANRWAPSGDGSNNPAAKAAAISAASGVPANQPINLADPATRARILPALFDTETPGWRNAIGGAQPAPVHGPMAAQPPLGATNAANASQGAPSEQMKTAYGALSNADTNYQASREALQAMLNIAQNGGLGDTAARLLPGNVATRMSNDAAEYEKAHANFVALQGKALGAAGTDASRATLEAAVPAFDKPQQAKIQGLTNQLQQLDLAHLKTQFLQPIYQAGDEKAYSKANAGFDQNITPQMTPVLMMQPGPQQKAAYRALVKNNPALKQNFQWALDNGMLK